MQMVQHRVVITSSFDLEEIKITLSLRVCPPRNYMKSSAGRIIGCIVKVVARFPKGVKGVRSSRELRHQWQGNSKA